MPPIKDWGTNINTYVMVAGFLLTFGINYGAYTAFKAETLAQIAEMKTQRATDVASMERRTLALETAVQGLAVQDARQIEQITAMLAYLQRIERTLDQLVRDGRDEQ